jgi:YD repeat-containing protein
LVTFKSEGARITSITDRYGLTTTINYDGAGRLQETKNPDGSIGTSISYASIPGLTLPTTIIDGGRSQTLVSYTVSRDTNAAYVRGVASPNGDIETYAYGPTFAEASGKNRPTVRVEYQDGYMSGLTLNGNRIQTLQRDANGTVLSVTESTGTTRFSYGNGRVTAAYPDGSQSETVRDENQHLISVSVTGSDGQTRTKKYTYAGTVLQNVSISKRGTVTSSQDYHYKDGAPARITTRVTNAVTLDSRGRPAAAVLGDGSDVTIARSTGAITTAVNGSSTTVQCAASPDGGITRQVNGGSGAVRFSLTAQSDASGLQSAWQTTFGNSISRGSRTGAVTLNGSSTTESCENSSSQCETVTSCVPNTFGGCDIQESTTCTQGESTSNPVTSDKPNTDPGYCSTSGANGCNPGYQPQIVQGPGRSTYCTCGRAANP